MERMKLIVAAGFWVLIIQQKLLHPADGMLLKMIGKHRIHRLQVLNLAIKQLLPGKAGVAIIIPLKVQAADLLFMETRHIGESWAAVIIKFLM